MKIPKTVSYFLIAFSTLTNPLTNVYAGGSFCDPTHTRKIPPLSETECNAILYSMFPKITEYKGQLWEAGPSCLYNGAGRFQEPKDVDAFVLEYTQAMVAGFKQ
jgi:hypothetical protein